MLKTLIMVAVALALSACNTARPIPSANGGDKPMVDVNGDGRADGSTSGLNGHDYR